MNMTEFAIKKLAKFEDQYVPEAALVMLNMTLDDLVNVLEDLVVNCHMVVSDYFLLCALAAPVKMSNVCSNMESSGPASSWMHVRVLYRHMFLMATDFLVHIGH